RLKAAGVPILGMEWWLDRDPRTRKYFQKLDGGAPDPAGEKRAVWVRSPNTAPPGSRNASTSQHHGDFDDDIATVKATLARMLGRRNVADAPVVFESTAAGNHRCRVNLDR